ncbi:MAG: DUF6580 family putative transport protein [Phycisphaerales bacterium]
MPRTLLNGTLIILALIGACVAGRLIPHWPNAAPVLSAALFAGFILRSRWAALAVPVVAMLVTDLIWFGTYTTGEMAVNYLALSLPILLGPALRGDKRTAWRVGGLSLGAALLFFAVSNFGVWLFGSMYGRSVAGLIECYVLALPFLKYTIAGAVAWSAVFFGSYELATRGAPAIGRTVRRLAPVS